MRARPEPTQSECLSDASFLGKLLVLPANSRLDWKVIARYKHSSFFGLIISNKGKKFYNIDTRIESVDAKFREFAIQITDQLQRQETRATKSWVRVLNLMVETHLYL